MYADGTTLYCNLNPGTPNFVNIINGEVSKCLSANRLSLNVNKTKVMFFYSVRKTVAFQNYISIIQKKTVLILLYFWDSKSITNSIGTISFVQFF